MHSTAARLLPLDETSSPGGFCALSAHCTLSSLWIHACTFASVTEDHYRSNKNAWGVDVIFGPARRRNQRHHRSFAQAPGVSPIHTGAAWRCSGVHGLRPREAYRKAWVCLATSGPGGIHLLNGVYDAQWW